MVHYLSRQTLTTKSLFNPLTKWKSAYRASLRKRYRKGKKLMMYSALRPRISGSKKDVIAQLENNLNNLNIEISKLPKGSIGQVEMKKQAAQLTAELKR